MKHSHSNEELCENRQVTRGHGDWAKACLVPTIENRRQASTEILIENTNTIELYQWTERRSQVYSQASVELMREAFFKSLKEFKSLLINY